MSMKKQILLIGFITFCIPLLLSFSALAECNNGKIGVTIVNPAGKAIEICVPENAVPGIETGIENSGGSVVAAICPCFTQEDLEVAVDFYGVTCARMNINFDSIGDVKGFNSEAWIGDSLFKTKLYEKAGFPVKSYHLEGVSNKCLIDIVELGAHCTSASVGDKILISTEQAFACQALLEATFDWQENIK